MANDIIGGPEPVIINGRFFQFSPLTDAEFSKLDAWVSMSLDKKVEALSEEGFAQLQTNAGCAQLLHLSISRNEKLTHLEAAEFLLNSEAHQDVFNFWYDLNFKYDMSEFDLPETTNSDEKISRNEIYISLSARYRWTPQQISELTPYQQFVYLHRNLKQQKQAASVPLEFANDEEYLKWAAANGKLD